MRNTLTESAIITLVSFALFIPFLAVQYDTNGLAEAFAIESGNLIHKNHVLYGIVGYLFYSGLPLIGHAPRAITVLQIINAACGALGAGFAYAAYKGVTHDRLAAVVGTAFLVVSFIYWLFSTDAAYITLAGMFANASMAALIGMHSRVSAILAGGLAAFSILTWQASIFLIPALCLLSLQVRSDVPKEIRRKDTVLYAATACIISGLTYTLIAFEQHGRMSASSLLRWFTSYGEGGTLPMWGKWEAPRTLLAARSALWSVVPVPLAIPVDQISWHVQKGRIAVDLALVGFGLLSLMALLKTRKSAVFFLLAYLVFIPFIVWWDPFQPKWFFIPNAFLAGFFAVALARWFRNPYASTAIFTILLVIAATNFIVAIRPRHNDIGLDSRIAQCVAEKMHPNDLLIAAEWGWPDYVKYLYGRKSLSVISEFSDVNARLDEVHRAGARAYITDPNEYSLDHLVWLEAQSHVRREDLTHLADAFAFKCYGSTILFAKTN